MSIEAEGIEKTSHTVAMDIATLDFEGFKIYLFGTPGLLRMQVMRDILAEGADGVLFLFDAVNSDNDEDAVKILDALGEHIESDVPIVFCANKSDEENARSPEEIKTQNNLLKDAVILPTSTKTGQNIEESLKVLASKVYEHYKSLFEILRKYQSNLKGLGEELQMDKTQLRDFLYTLEFKKLIEIDRKNQSIKVKEESKELI